MEFLFFDSNTECLKAIYMTNRLVSYTINRLSKEKKQNKIKSTVLCIIFLLILHMLLILTANFCWHFQRISLRRRVTIHPPSLIYDSVHNRWSHYRVFQVCLLRERVC